MLDGGEKGLKKQFSIANVRIEVSSALPLRAEERWRLFETEFDAAELSYHVCSAAQLPVFHGERCFDSERVRVQEQNGRMVRTYFDTITGDATATVEEIGDLSYRITIQEALLPWGCDVADLFTQYGFPHCLPQFGKLLLHCAYILHRGKAILFTAPSGTGKTTQATLWQRYCGSKIINGDRAAIGLENGTVMAYGLPISGTSPDCKNVTAPVAAIVKLSQAKENRVTRLNDLDAARCLLSGSYLPQEFSRDLPVLFDLAVSIGQCVPVFHLECLPEESAVRALLPLLME